MVSKHLDFSTMCIILFEHFKILIILGEIQ